MNSQQAIIEKIIGDANEAAQRALSQAASERDSILSNAKFSAGAKLKTVKGGLPDVRQRIIERRKTVAEIDVKKLVLAKKKQLIDEAFSKALDILCGVDEKKYLSIIADMLNEAEDGDKVVIATADKGVISAAFVKKCAEKRGVKFTLSDSFGDFRRGIVLVGKNYDKDFTFDSELSSLKETMETEVAQILFGEEADGD